MQNLLNIQLMCRMRQKYCLLGSKALAIAQVRVFPTDLAMGRDFCCTPLDTYFLSFSQLGAIYTELFLSSNVPAKKRCVFEVVENYRNFEEHLECPVQDTRNIWYF